MASGFSNVVGPLCRVEPSRLSKIMVLALPIIGGMVSQNVLNVVDTLMVSHYGKHALAAVGGGGALNFVSVAFVMGMSAGVQAMAARRMGEGRKNEMAESLNGGLLLGFLVAIPASLVLIFFASDLFMVVTGSGPNSGDVSEIGVPYYQARVAGMVFVAANFAFRGYWNGVNLSRLYLKTILVMHVANVGISYLLIFGALGFPEMKAMGAGVGTTISTLLGTLYYFYLGNKHARQAGFLRAKPSRDLLRSLFRISDIQCACISSLHH